MRAGLNREVVRERTGYKVGRTIVDVLLILELIGVIILAVQYLRPLLLNPQGSADIAVGAGIVGVAAVAFLVAILQREIIHALFDIADRAIDGAASKPGENPLA